MIPQQQFLQKSCNSHGLFCTKQTTAREQERIISVLDIAKYEVSADRGFLSVFDPAEIELPAMLRPAREMAMDLPKLLPTGEVRHHLEKLPLVECDGFCQEADYASRRVAMVHYSFMAQAYVWGEEKAPEKLPECIARPLWQISQSVNMPPLLTYSDYVLDNWSRVDPARPIDLSNICMLQPFLSGEDEAWFVLIHVAIEARAGEMLALIPRMMEAAERHDAGSLERDLKTTISAWADLNAIFDRMPERCDPYIYFHRVRPWIHGWKDNPALGEGLIYEGVEASGGKPMAYRGQTGSQSSIVPSFDAFLGVVHAGDPLRVFLDELHQYRPLAHRKFIEAIREESSIRTFVQSSSTPVLKELYNECIAAITRFRSKHLEYAASYINKQSRGGYGNDHDVGTGGTPFMKYLKKHRDECEEHLIQNRL